MRTTADLMEGSASSAYIRVRARQRPDLLVCSALRPARCGWVRRGSFDKCLTSSPSYAVVRASVSKTPLCRGIYRDGSTSWPWPSAQLDHDSKLSPWVLAAQHTSPAHLL